MLRCRTENKVECGKHQKNYDCGPEDKTSALCEHSELEHAGREAIVKSHLETEDNPAPLHLPLLMEPSYDCNQTKCVEDAEKQECEILQLTAVRHIEDSRRDVRLAVECRMREYIEGTDRLLLCELRANGCDCSLSVIEAERREGNSNYLTGDLQNVVT